jgi:dolichyl-phosphate beta-glucosyltransferase
MLSRKAAIITFSNLHVLRWAFDVDMLYIAEHFKMRVHECDINWHECEGSKLTVASFVEMGMDLLSIRVHYMLGAWKLDADYRMSD